VPVLYMKYRFLHPLRRKASTRLSQFWCCRWWLCV